jgi:Predicted choloylglycine hydrolase
VIAQSDCLWSVLDGINEDGLAISLTFGGRRIVGDGFGVPILLRYVLEVCRAAEEAAETICRIPTHMAYNVTALDAAGNFFTAQLSPDRAPFVDRRPVATNHQGQVEWHRHARMTATVEREKFLLDHLARKRESVAAFIAVFLKPPLYSVAYDRGFGTLYTAVYDP